MAKAGSKIRLSPPVTMTILAWPKQGKRRTSRRRNESDFSACTFPNPVSSHQMTRAAHQSTLGFTSASFFLRVPSAPYSLSLSCPFSRYYYSYCPFYFSSSSDLNNYDDVFVCCAFCSSASICAVRTHKTAHRPTKDIRSLTQQTPSANGVAPQDVCLGRESSALSDLRHKGIAKEEKKE